MKLLLTIGLFVLAFLEGDAWKVTKSDISFKVKHGFGTYADGDFQLKSSVLVFNPAELNKAKIEAKVLTTTISTGLGIRDNVLRKSDYFDCVQYPEMAMVLVGTPKKVKEGLYSGTFTLKIKATEKLLTLPFSVNIEGNKAVFSTNFQIDRTEFGVGESSFALGNEVKVSVRVEGMRD